MLLPLIEAPTAASTVGGWGRLLGYTGRAGPAELLKEYGVRLPALDVVRWVRIISMLDWTWRKRKPPKIRIVAKRFGFRSDGATRTLNDYCRRQAQRRYADLVALGPERVLRLLADQAAPDRTNASIAGRTATTRLR